MATFDWGSVEEVKDGVSAPSASDNKSGTAFDWSKVEEAPAPEVQTAKPASNKRQGTIGFLESLASFMSAPEYAKQLADVGLFKKPSEYWDALSKDKAEQKLKEQYGIENAPAPTTLSERVERTAGALALPTLVTNPLMGVAGAGAVGGVAGLASVPAAIGLGAGLSEGGGEIAAKSFGEEARPYGQLAGGVVAAFPQVAIQRGIEKGLTAKANIQANAASVKPVFQEISESSGITPLSAKVKELDETFKATSPELSATPYMLVNENPVLLDTVKSLTRSGLRQYGISGAKIQGQAIGGLEEAKGKLSTLAKTKLDIDDVAQQKAFELAQELGTTEGQLRFFSQSPVVKNANMAIERANQQLDDLGFNVRALGNTSDTGSAVKASVEDAIKIKRNALNAQYQPLFDEADKIGVKFSEATSQSLLDSFSQFRDHKIFSDFPRLWNKVQNVLEPKVVGREVKTVRTPTGTKDVVVNSGVREYPELRLSDLHNLKQQLGEIGWSNSEHAGVARQLYKDVSSRIDELPDSVVKSTYLKLNEDFSNTVYKALDLKTVKAMSQDVWDSTVSGYLAKPQTIKEMLKATELVGGDTQQVMKLTEDALTARLAKSVVDVDGKVNQAKFNTFFEQHKEALALPEMQGVRDKLLSYRDSAIKLSDEIASQESAREYVRKEIANSAFVRMSGRGVQDAVNRMRADDSYFRDSMQFFDTLPEKSKGIMMQAVRGEYFDDLVRQGSKVDDYLKQTPVAYQYKQLFGDNLEYVKSVARVSDEINKNLSVIREMTQPVTKALSDQLEKQTGISLSTLGGWMANQVQSAKYVVMNSARKTILYRQDQARLKQLYQILGDTKTFNKLLLEAEQGGKPISTVDKFVQYVQDKGLVGSAIGATGNAAAYLGRGVTNMTPEAVGRGVMTYQFTTEPKTRGEVKGMFEQ